VSIVEQFDSHVCPLNYLKQVFIRPFSRINLTSTTTKEITEIIKSLKSTNSHGFDEIPINVLKTQSALYNISSHLYM